MYARLGHAGQMKQDYHLQCGSPVLLLSVFFSVLFLTFDTVNLSSIFLEYVSCRVHMS